MGVGSGPIIEFDKYFQPLRLPLFCVYRFLNLFFFSREEGQGIRNMHARMCLL